MYGPLEYTNYLPLLTIATPDKLFYDATASRHERFGLRFFGGYFVRCSCGYCEPAMSPPRNGDKYKCSKCKSELDYNDRESSPIGYYVFDEVHSLHGLDGMLLSIFMQTLQVMADKIQGQKGYLRGNFYNRPVFETGTATIANEQQLIGAITRLSDEQIDSFPKDGEYNDYFELQPNRVRYRTAALLPVGKSVRTSMTNVLRDTYDGLYEASQNLKNSILTSLSSYVVPSADYENTYDFILGYLFRKEDGRAIRSNIVEMTDGRIYPEFLSGDVPPDEAARIYNKIRSGETNIIIANLVISLGIDIEQLNNMIMMGMPKSVSEFIQTAGRTGRRQMPGHVMMHLLPSIPRDMFVYKNFHRFMCDLTGYLDVKPIQPTNIYAAQIIAPNVIKTLLAAQSYSDFVLTAKSASNYLSNASKQNQLLLEMLRVAILPDLDENIRQEITRRLRDILDDTRLLFQKRSGATNYLSDVMREDLLTSLRTRSETVEPQRLPNPLTTLLLGLGSQAINLDQEFAEKVEAETLNPDLGIEDTEE